MQVPYDIKIPWLNVVKRLQSVAKSDGLQLVSITVLVDADGIPRLWLEPTCKKIEPSKAAHDILDLLTQQGKPLNDM